MSMADDDRKNTKDSWLNKMPSEVKAEAHKQTWRFCKSDLEILLNALKCHQNWKHSVPYGDRLGHLIKKIAAGLENC